MELTGTDMKVAGTALASAPTRPGAAFEVIRRVRDRWLEARGRRALCDLEGVSDHLLRDVGLRRECFPSGNTRVTRF